LFTDAIGKFLTSGDVFIASVTFTGDGFASASSGSAANSTITTGTNETGGTKTIAKFELYEDDDTTLIGSSAVGNLASGEAVKLSSLDLADDDTVSLTSFTITAS
jgi:hypothetical protein